VIPLKPIAFRIWDFKSIADSGECHLSADNITVLAGQNESGKTAILQALRDFDLEAGSKPRTPDYTPDGRLDSARPRVAVKFSFDADELRHFLTEESALIPPDVGARIHHDGDSLWIVRDLPAGKFELNPDLKGLWKNSGPGASPGPESQLPQEPPPAAKDSTEAKALSADEFAKWLRSYWPSFVYFDSFEDTLPRTVDVSLIQASAAATKNPVAGSPGSTVPRPVQDFITLSGLDTTVIEKFSTEDKALYNYLSNRSAKISGDFLTYWKQRAGKEQTVTLQVRHQRNAQGVQQLAFYVHDQTDQYPEQRSKGFLWFLSFYLRLAAEQLRDPERERLLLIDEPGSYLHARAQRDVLHLLEDRLSKKDEIVYSTHSHFLIPADKLHRLRVVLKTPETGTVVVDRLTHPLLRGEEFSDTLSPILEAIGLDIRQAVAFVRDKNLIAEGISEQYYLSAWSRMTDVRLSDEVHIFPATGAMSEVTLASLFIGWGLDFVALLDREPNGDAARDKLLRELGVPQNRVIQPDQALGIEDLFSEPDFGVLLASLDPALTIQANEKPTAAMKRQKVDKVLLARRFAEDQSAGRVNPTPATRDRVAALLNRILQAFPVNPA
jgi:hypothetical protein